MSSWTKLIGFDLPEQRVHLKTGVELEYDYLIIATGSTHSYFGRDDWAKLAPGLKTIEDATEIRRRVLLAFELAERQMMETGTHPPLNFVIIGGGPTGVELAGAISDIAKLYMAKDFRHIDPSMAQVLILEGSPNILAAYPPDLQRKAGEQLNALGVKFRTNAHVSDVQPGYVMVGDERIDAVVTLWAAGVQASPLGKLLGVRDGQARLRPRRQSPQPSRPSRDLHLRRPCARRGERQADSRRRPARHADGPLRREAHRPLVAVSFGSDGSGKDEPFHYFDKGDMATIGRKAAVANIQWPFKGHWSGFPAWMTWLVVHIFFLIGFRNRLVGLPSVGLDLPYLQRWSAPDHRLAGAAGMEPTDECRRQCRRQSRWTWLHQRRKRQFRIEA